MAHGVCVMNCYMEQYTAISRVAEWCDYRLQDWQKRPMEMESLVLLAVIPKPQPVTGRVAISQISLTLRSLGLNIGHDQGHRLCAGMNVGGGCPSHKRPRVSPPENF